MVEIAPILEMQTTKMALDSLIQILKISIPSKTQVVFFHLNNGDNPGLNLVSNLLIGNNYNYWSHAMKMALVTKNKLSFFHGIPSRPSPDGSL